MTHPTRLKHTACQFDFDHCLKMYALAASTAGVGVLALAQPAEGKIIYTKANKFIGSNMTVHVDVNHDGLVDFDLKDVLTTSTAGGAFGTMSAVPHRKQNAIRGHTVPFHAYASALFANARIGPNGQFLPAAGFMAAYSISGGRHQVRPPGNFSCTGPWANVTDRYLGLKFAIKGQTHFGWARLNVSCSGATVSGTLTGYAYETIPNKPILAGKQHGTDESSISSEVVSENTLTRLARGTGRHIVTPKTK